MTTEMTIILQESPASTENATAVEKEATRMFIVGQRKKNRKTMPSTTSLWEPRYVDNSKKRTMEKI